MTRLLKIKRETIESLLESLKMNKASIYANWPKKEIEFLMASMHELNTAILDDDRKNAPESQHGDG